MRVRRALVRGRGGADENADESFRILAFQGERDVHGFVGSMINASKRRSPRPRPRAVFVSKRGRRFERPAFTSATRKDTDPGALAETISCGDGKGVTRTGTNRCPKKCNQVEPPAFNVIKLDLAGQSGDVSLKGAAICFTD